MNREQMVEKAARAMLEDDLAADRAADDWDNGADRAWLMSNARAVLDAILPQVTCVAELEALPLGTKIIAKTGRVWWRSGRVWRCETGLVRRPEGLAGHGPMTVVWQPEVTE